MLDCSNCREALTWPYFTCTVCINPTLYLCLKCYKNRSSSDSSFLNQSFSSQIDPDQGPSIFHHEHHDFLKVASKFENDNLEYGDLSDSDTNDSQEDTTGETEPYPLPNSNSNSNSAHPY